MSFNRDAHATLSAAEWSNDCKGADDEIPHAVNHKGVAAHTSQVAIALEVFTDANLHSRLAELKMKTDAESGT